MLVQKMWCQLFFGFLCANFASAITNSSDTVTQRHQQGKTGRFTAEELMTTRFPRKISKDVDLDPCKAGKSVFLYVAQKANQFS